MSYLDNVIVQHADTFYEQEEGINTGDKDNHWVPLAIIALILCSYPIAINLNKTHLYKRFIDDIAWLSHGKNFTHEIKIALKDYFYSKWPLRILPFRKIDSNQNEGNVEFLYVIHVIDHNASHGFNAKEFITSTSTNQTSFRKNLTPFCLHFKSSPTVRLYQLAVLTKFKKVSFPVLNAFIIKSAFWFQQ